MIEMNKDLPYEQQVKVLLRHYDQLVEENKALKARIKEMEDERAKYGDPKELQKKLKSLPSNVKQLRELYNERDSRINWGKKKLVNYLRSAGVKSHPSCRSQEPWNGNRIAYPSIKVWREGVALKMRTFSLFHIYF